MATTVRNASGSMMQIRVFATVDDTEPCTIPVLYRINKDVEMECYLRERPRFPNINRHNNICIVSDDLYIEKR